MEVGIGVGVGLSLLLVIYRSAFPRIAILGRLPNTEIYRCVPCTLGLLCTLASAGGLAGEG